MCSHMLLKWFENDIKYAYIYSLFARKTRWYYFYLVKCKFEFSSIFRSNQIDNTITWLAYYNMQCYSMEHKTAIFLSRSRKGTVLFSFLIFFTPGPSVTKKPDWGRGEMRLRPTRKIIYYRYLYSWRERGSDFPHFLFKINPNSRCPKFHIHVCIYI